MSGASVPYEHAETQRDVRLASTNTDVVAESPRADLLTATASAAHVSQPQFIEVIDPTDESGGRRWDALVTASGSATVFHSAAWARVLADSYGYTPVYLHYRGCERNGILVPCMEMNGAWGGKRCVSLPFTDFCGILGGHPHDTPYMVTMLADCARARNWQSVEIRGACGDATSASDSYYRHRLSLKPEPEVLLGNCAGVIRTNIRRARKQGVSTVIAASQDAVYEYYRLHCLTRKRYGLPPQPIAFFDNIRARLIDKGMGFVVLGYFEDRAVAGAVYLGFGKNAVFKFGASDYRFQSLRANSLVMWNAISHLRSLGYTDLCFGRTDLDAEGLRRFKSHWGTSECVVSYHKYNVRRGLFEGPSQSHLGLARRVLRHAPVSVLRTIGTAIYRYWG